MTGQVFTNAIPMPEPPKKNILFNLFASGPKPCDREELFGETAGKASSTIAKQYLLAKALNIFGLNQNNFVIYNYKFQVTRHVLVLVGYRVGMTKTGMV